ncbi:MAG: SDR family NAD(P)-dependent oxidoreductase [Deltaproteobacteria bacterium]|nr:SDR family NAD(P)-dependent oxidoreductase [Deltaproteobacteria bacterium]MCK5421864.1 SDR family NAD(P)-dependent oxidoreductase [Deltaproteobacteria bacterium]
MNWAQKKVLVTGAEGFIGSHLTERLVALGAEVKALVMYNSFNTWGWIDTFRPGEKNKLHIICADIREADLLKSTLKDIDIVFHLAALIAIPYSYASPSSYIKTNIEGTLNLLQAARDHGVEKFLHTSTSEVYGTALYTPIDEKHSLQGQSPYSASKIGADMIAESFHRSFDLPVTTVRPFNTYGPRQSLRAIIPTMILQMLNSNKIRLGSLQPIRDFTYVSDTVEGFIKAAETDEIDGEVINIGSANGISIGKLAEKLMKMMNKKITIESEEKRVRPSKSEVNQLICNNNKAKELIDWQPKMSLDEGLEKTINWFKANAGEYKSDIYNI